MGKSLKVTRSLGSALPVSASLMGIYDLLEAYEDGVN